MIIREVMTRDVRIASPDDTLLFAAQVMESEDFGSLPIAEDQRLVGMLTDRDITVRGVAHGMAPRDCAVREIMSTDIKYVYDDESVSDAAKIMGDMCVRRLPVLDRDQRLVGIVSLGDLALSKPTSAGDVLQSIVGAEAVCSTWRVRAIKPSAYKK
jgi:CBS domain-containing protein